MLAPKSGRTRLMATTSRNKTTMIATAMARTTIWPNLTANIQIGPDCATDESDDQDGDARAPRRASSANVPCSYTRPRRDAMTQTASRRSAGVKALPTALTSYHEPSSSSSSSGHEQDDCPEIQSDQPDHHHEPEYDDNESYSDSPGGDESDSQDVDHDSVDHNAITDESDDQDSDRDALNPRDGQLDAPDPRIAVHNPQHGRRILDLGDLVRKRCNRCFRHVKSAVCRPISCREHRGHLLRANMPATSFLVVFVEDAPLAANRVSAAAFEPTAKTTFFLLHDFLFFFFTSFSSCIL
ncbi:hypothetical protein BC940DRAFT_139458 [Gongronella butleri]|nr:hypothetical protein BC940DRAFT_139458 [Gongronella butleri]